MQNLREELNSFESYGQLYEQQGNYLTARNFYERAIVLAQILEDSKQEVQLLDQLTKIKQLWMIFSILTATVFCDLQVQMEYQKLPGI